VRQRQKEAARLPDAFADSDRDADSGRLADSRTDG
jgi:hypothetical protein